MSKGSRCFLVARLHIRDCALIMPSALQLVKAIGLYLLHIVPLLLTSYPGKGQKMGYRTFEDQNESLSIMFLTNIFIVSSF